MSERSANLLAALAVALHDELVGSLAEAEAPNTSAAAALATLHSHPGEGIDALSRVVGLTESGTVRLVASLVEQGLVDKQPGRDARAVALRLTAAGHRKARRVLASRNRRMEAVVDGLNSNDRRLLVQLAEKILAGLTSGQADADRICRLCHEAVCPDAECPVELAIPR